MAIDFEIPEDAKAVRARVREWVETECIPAEARLKDKETFKTVLAELRAKARAQGLWLPFIPKEYGGMGLGPLANALVRRDLVISRLIERTTDGSVYRRIERPPPPDAARLIGRI